MQDNLNLWNAVRRPPTHALKPIAAGRLKGMSDVNPVWRLEALTEQYGPCGIGWYYEITDRWTDLGPEGQVMCFIQIHLYTATLDDEGQKGWSAPIAGIGGSALVAKESGGLRASDEGWKMALTDALSVSMKSLGVAADVYRGFFRDSKYTELSKPNLVIAKTPRTIVEIRQALADAAQTGGDTALRAVWATIDEATKPTLREYLNTLKAQKKAA